MADATLVQLRELYGYIQDDSQVDVTISQDDATKDFIVTVGNKHFYGHSMITAIQRAYKELKE